MLVSARSSFVLARLSREVTLRRSRLGQCGIEARGDRFLVA